MRGAWRLGARLEMDTGMFRAGWLGASRISARSIPTNRTRAAPMGTAVWARGRALGHRPPATGNEKSAFNTR